MSNVSCTRKRTSIPLTGLITALMASLSPTLGHSQQAAPSMCYVPGSGTVYLIKADKTPSTCRSGHAAVQLTAPTSAGPQWGPGGGGNAISTNSQGAFDFTNNNGLVAPGSWGTGNIPATGAGTRLMWYPGKAAFRAGVVLGNQWDDANVGLASVALGHNTTASGHYSFASSTNALASGNGSFAMGDHAEATAANAAAVGYRTRASGSASVGMGDQSEATAAGAFAVGFKSMANGSASVAMGNLSEATGAASFAAGSGAKALGEKSTAIGGLSQALGSYSLAMRAGKAQASGSIAIGDLTVASGVNAIALGYSAVASGVGSMALGHYSSTNGKWYSFVFGDASAGATEVKAVVDNQFVVRAQKFWLGTNSNVTATANRFIETSTGAYLSTGGAWVSSSDSTKKHRWQDVDGEDVLTRLVAMPIRSWSYREEGDSVRHVGPTAQDFRNAFGLGDTDKAIASVDADGVSLAGIKALVQRTVDLRRENEELRAALGDVLRRLAELEAARR